MYTDDPFIRKLQIRNAVCREDNFVGRWMEKRINKMFTREASEVDSNTIALAAGIKLKHEQDEHCKVDRRNREEVLAGKDGTKKMTHVCDIDVFC